MRDVSKEFCVSPYSKLLQKPSFPILRCIKGFLKWEWFLGHGRREYARKHNSIRRSTPYIRSIFQFLAHLKWYTFFLYASLRLALLNEAKEVRAAGLRSLRYLIRDTAVLHKVLKLQVDYLIARWVPAQTRWKVLSCWCVWEVGWGTIPIFIQLPSPHFPCITMSNSKKSCCMH